MDNAGQHHSIYVILVEEDEIFNKTLLKLIQTFANSTAKFSEIFTGT